MKIIARQKNKGFALLFSVLISSLLLTIGLSIFGITLKELTISTAARQSIHAFYAADSGLEYAKYHDLKLGDLLIYPGGLISDAWSPAPVTRTSEVVTTGDLGEPNFSVTIQKNKIAGGIIINTTITSTGWDVTDGDKVERAIQQTY